MEIIANVYHNWLSPDGKSTERTIEMVEAAAKAGVDSICFQMFKADLLYREKKDIDMTSMYEMPTEVLTAGVNNAKRLGLRVYITPQYVEAVAISERLLKPYGYHIADGDLRHDELIEAVGKTNKPTLIASGLYAFSEMEDPLAAFFDPEKVTLLHSTGGLPTLPKDAKLPVMLDMAAHFWKMGLRKFGVESTFRGIGLDGVAMGYRPDVLMKTLDLDKEGIGAAWSISPKEFAALVELDQIISEATNPELEFENLTATDIAQRDRVLRDPDDFLTPCECHLK